jgi:electron transfer flavoprotein alpha/beta subunit
MILSVKKERNFPRLPTLDGKLKARALDIPVWDADTLGLEEPTLGLLIPSYGRAGDGNLHSTPTTS